jgi:hypothetical protein
VPPKGPERQHANGALRSSGGSLARGVFSVPAIYSFRIPASITAISSLI